MCVSKKIACVETERVRHMDCRFQIDKRTGFKILRTLSMGIKITGSVDLGVFSFNTREIYGAG